MDTLIKAVELWTPDRDGQLLEHADGLYGDAFEFDAVSRARVFGRGEGLPGRVWTEGQPILLPSLDDPLFRRGKAARKAGYAAAVALPFHRDGRVAAVVVLYIGTHAAGRIAVELWQRGAGGDEWVAGHYGTGGEAVAMATLPESAWARRAAIRLDGSSRPLTFLDALAPAVGAQAHGLAIPCVGEGDDDDYLLTLVAPQSVPLFRRVETWTLDAPTASPLRLDGLADGGRLATGTRAAETDADEALMLEAFAGAIPRLRATATIGADDVDGTLMLPVVRDGRAVEVVSLGM